MRYLICYDIPDDRRRNRLSKFLLDYGQRVQYSVFECDLTRKVLDGVIKGIVEYTDSKEDNVRVYSLCAGCAALIKTFGPQRLREPSSAAIVV